MPIKARESACSAIRRVEARVQSSEYGGDIHAFRFDLEKIGKEFEKFSAYHASLLEKAEETEIPAHKMLELEMDEAVRQTVIKLRRLIAESECQQASPTKEGRQEGRQGDPSELRMETLKIKQFDGRDDSWLKFRDLFESLVHNRPHLDEACKLARLEQYVDQSQVTMMGGVYNGEYEALWMALKKRYDRPRRLVESHMNRLLDLPDYPADSRETLRRVIDEFRNYLRAMKALKQPIETWNAIVYGIIVRKISVGATAYVIRAAPGDGVPEPDEVLRQVEDYADTLPSLDQHGGPERGDKRLKVNMVKVGGQERRVPKCALCNESHWLNKCERFGKMTIEQRLDLMGKRKLCVMCLNTWHVPKMCKFRRGCGSDRCQDKHHPMLCRQMPARGMGTPPVFLPAQ